MEIERLLPLSCGSLNQELADFNDEFFPLHKERVISMCLKHYAEAAESRIVYSEIHRAFPITNDIYPAPMMKLRNSG